MNPPSILFLIALALAAAPFAAQAETWNIYGWQNHSWDFVDIDGGQSFDRISSNAGNIGFAASVPTGMNDISVNVRCEQFTYFNHFAGGTGWCNRNSKIGLSHPQMGEIMFATWLLPYNEGVAQWVDPFYDAGADSHTSIMGSVGAHTIFYNTVTSTSKPLALDRAPISAVLNSTTRVEATILASTVVRRTSSSTGRRTGTVSCSASRGPRAIVMRPLCLVTKSIQSSVQ